MAAAAQRQLRSLIEVGTRNIAHAQTVGEIAQGRDPELMAAAVLAGVHAATATAIERPNPPSPDDLFIEIWQFVSNAVRHTD